MGDKDKTLSLRRELDEKERQSTKVYNEAEDLTKYSREQLEQELKALRKQANVYSLQLIEAHEGVRDALSHAVTGKDSLEYLHLNKTAPVPNQEQKSVGEALSHAAKRALGGGLPGAMAMSVQVVTLMWLRTTMNYQYRYGTSTMVALKTLYKEGGIPRFYKGMVPALAQGPLSRFGDTAANSGTLALLSSFSSTRDLPIAIQTMCASAVAAAWRVNLMPVDTVKTIMQVEGSKGLSVLRDKFKKSGIRVLYHGAVASSVATFVGHFPWFFTHNFLNEKLPKGDTFQAKLLRNAGIGFCSSFVSDLASNSIRVVKVAKQASVTAISYPDAIKAIIAQDGISGLFFRGLGTRVIANGIQGMLFTVIWKGVEEELKKREKAEKENLSR